MAKLDLQRLQQLELLLRWEGQIGNARIRELFGLTQIRASQWLREFRDSHPTWIEWNTVTRTFFATFRFYTEKNKDDSQSLSRYLSLISLSPDMENQHSNVVSAFNEITTPDPKNFAILTNAARSNREVEITYCSMGEPIPHSRIIAPHSIVKAGPRWHVRAYSELNKQFRDYTLGRISDVKLLNQPAKFSIKDDKDWLTEVNVSLIAHPDLTQDQQLVVRQEYFAKTMARVTVCRGPLVNYFINNVGAAVDVEKQRPPEYFLAVENVKEISKWLFKK
ncbi:MAG: WYL domain-containing protein [Methylotenera sp.]|nr:WYL domain-containing protein [Methylotenera sp.]